MEPGHWGKKDAFEQAFLEELDREEPQLPLEHMCDQGAWPDPGSLELSIESTRVDTSNVYVIVGCTFNELVATACVDRV